MKRPNKKPLTPDSLAADGSQGQGAIGCADRERKITGSGDVCLLRVRPPLTGGRCECAGCGLRFTSVREFDRHRAGAHAERGRYLGSRRCRDLADLLAHGWQMDERGYLRQGRRERAQAGMAGTNEGGSVASAVPAVARARA